MFHRLPPIDRDPEVGDLGSMGPRVKPTLSRKHGVGMIVKKHVISENESIQYESNG